jgi:hypothetical protein
MSRTTDRLNAQNVINLAREQYETQQRSQLPSVMIDLPSKGKTYPESSILSSGIVEMRYPTAYDEDILSNASYIKQGIAINKLIESLLVKPFDIDDLIIADKEKIVLSARILAYGPEYPVTVKDPKTNKELSRIIDLYKISASELEIESDENGEFTYQVDDKTTLRFIIPNTGIIDNLSQDRTISDLLCNIIREINGNRDKEHIKSFVKFNFLSDQAKRFRIYVAEHTPKLNTTYEFEGEDGSTFNAGFQFGSDLFWD